jgi:cellulose synthase (UDP-forming)
MLSKTRSIYIPEPPRGVQWQPRWATVVMFCIIGLSGLVTYGWFTGEGNISKIFKQIALLQERPPFWLEVPMLAGTYLLVPTVILLLGLLAVMKLSPIPRRWSRTLVIGILLTLTLRYIVWRSLSTLNLVNPLQGSFSILLLFLELLVLVSSSIQLALMLRVKNRRREADLTSLAVKEGTFKPTVDILIPTYNEPTFVLKRTIMGCQLIKYPHKQIYLLDDTQRPEVKTLARSLGCHYITRPDNRHAKAGNLNHAIAHTQGDLIAVFDADFVPTRNFLERTVGFFQSPQVGLVQTPQSFYNADPIARNLGLEDVVTPEEEVFYRQIQPIRDGAGSVVCSGTSFLVSRAALQRTGGFVTDSLSEDYFTGIRLSAQGYHLIYLDEKLSAGLAAENIAAHATQRLRWARGTLQAFFIEANPLTIPGLTFLQRLAHTEGILCWFGSFSKIGFLMYPLAYAFLGIIPLRATFSEILYFLLPFYIAQLATFSWLNGRSRSALLSEIYGLVLAFPLAFTVLQVMLINPFGRGFKVTPKGIIRDRYKFNWRLAWPLVLLFLGTALSVWRNLGMCMVKGDWQGTVSPELAQTVKGVGLGWLWSTYNLVLLGVALLILLDVPKPDRYDWFDLRRTVKLTAGDCTFWGITTMMSEGGAEIALTQDGLDLSVTDKIQLHIMEADLDLVGTATQVGWQEEGFPIVRVQFSDLTLEQERVLVNMLFCRPGQWQSHAAPGELRSLWILLRTLLKPRVIFDRDADVRAISVAKV